MPNITFYNTLSRKDEEFKPLDPNHVKMYACGPTVYDRAHIGNARSAVVYDVLSRFLRHQFPKLTYVRNITDVDDKINAAAKANGEPISALTKRVTQWYHDDMGALGCLHPDVEPRATEHIPQMIKMIEDLIANGNAYAAEGHALFSVASDPHYGCLSRRNRDEMIAGARVEVAPYKKDPADFVLWKPANEGDDPSSVFDSPWGKGRPGWHIECSAMSKAHLGADFDIHGGGADLMFPHHENEIAQSTCATKNSQFARYWVHNGFLTVNGEKMSKSLGNFFTVRDLLDKEVKGEVIRLALMSTHYRKPLDWNDKLLDDAQKTLDGWYRVLMQRSPQHEEILSSAKVTYIKTSKGTREHNDVLRPLYDDLNVVSVFAHINELRNYVAHSDDESNNAVAIAMIEKAGSVLGILQESPEKWFKGGLPADDAAIESKIAERNEAKKNKDFAASDRIRDELKAQGIILEDKPGGVTEWRKA